MSRPYAEVIGDPIAHSKSPLIHNFWLAKLGIYAEYRACRISVADLANYLAQRRQDCDWHGCNVTMPHKEAVLDHVDSIDKWATGAGAANCVSSQDGVLYATNTDVWGVSATVGLRKLAGPVVLLGAGGAARAVLQVLIRQKVSDIHVVVRDSDRGRSLLDSFGVAGRAHKLDDTLSIPPSCALINASPLGMTGKPPMPRAVIKLLEKLDDDGLVFDMVYDPLETALLAAARERRLVVVNGLTMLVDQARDSFNKLFGIRPPLIHDVELFKILTA